MIRPLGRRKAIDVLERRHGYFPKLFAWRGQWYDVHAVERCWTVSRRGLWGRIERTCFRLRARPRSGGLEGDATFTIYQNLRKGTWHMGRRLA
ncbi:MAG: hypothetical protein PVJ55_05140 [Anaerolineae bacterium]|jgi:hypothetical protein